MQKTIYFCRYKDPLMENYNYSNENSVKTMVSFGFGRFAAELFNIAFTTYAFYYYEQVVGLSTAYTAIGLIIYAIWNALNDPIVGFLTNKPITKLAPKWGKRYPYILFSAIPWVFFYILIFSPPLVDPETSQPILFLWLVICTCLFDTLYSIWDVNYQAIFPDKFRSDYERRKAAGIGTIVGVFGIAIGALVPSLIISKVPSASYLTQGVVIALIGFFAVFCMLPGVQETPKMIERTLAADNEPLTPKGFFKLFKDVLKNKNVMSFLLLYMLYQSLTQSMMGSIPYFVEYILETEKSVVTIVMAGFLVGALLSIPIWVKIMNKLNSNRFMILLGSVLLALFTAPLLFASDLTSIIIIMVIWGTGLGLFWTMIGPVFADCIDEVVVMTKKRQEGIYMGFRAFFGRLAYSIQALNFWLVHHLTGWQDGSSVQTSEAIFGIRIHMVVVPIILILIGAVLFLLFNDLHPKKVADIKEQLKQLDL